eukprot:CAMPEP_0119432752 /NCGR_PEP_ID=MMETSP1335-20130426/48408_1 /TAXON_ID=259385 /ORGANISM="Chrysoculter rhomboideus, Strain RCC1486" /LENGTH=191 /DNA_ID=CAMNT_0007458587 /DNA_START=17 /DNA_END=592 /DNA_ORIENTATION=+
MKPPIPADAYADEYVFRGPIIGPLGHKEVVDTQAGFDLMGAFPDLERECFGYSVDPQNPFRCLFFERWTATMTGELKIGPLRVPPTGKRVELPLWTSSYVWNPEGRIIYGSVSNPIDRFEGTTNAGAVIGLLEAAGVDAGGNVGDSWLIARQRLNQAISFAGKTWSAEEDIPSWWKSKARGADPTDTKSSS